MKNCLRCWLHIEDNPKILWCKNCLERVKEELEWKADRPFEYYFRFNLKRMRHERNTNGNDS